MDILIIGLALFLGVHSISILGAGWREHMVARIGPGPWRGIYSLLSLVGLILIVEGFGLARAAPIVLYTPPLWLHYVTVVLMLPVFPLLFAAYLPGRIRSAAKHPMLTAIKFWALAHLLANGSLADVLLFGGLLLWAGFDRVSLKRRPPQPALGAPPLPSNDTLAVVLGLALYVAFVLGLHQRLFGVSPLAGLF